MSGRGVKWSLPNVADRSRGSCRQAAAAVSGLEEGPPRGSGDHPSALAGRPRRSRGSRVRGQRSEAWAGPIYLDASALVKLFVPEPVSDRLNRALVGTE